MTNIIVNGALGKMGKFIINKLNKKGYDIIGGVDISKSIYNGITITDNLDELIDKKVKPFKKDKRFIIIDFSKKNEKKTESLVKNSRTEHYQNILKYIENDINPIIGIDGVNTKEINKIIQLSKKKNLGGVIACDFSIGTFIMNSINPKIASLFEHTKHVKYFYSSDDENPNGKIKQVDIGKDIYLHSNISNIKLACSFANFENEGEMFSISHKIITREPYVDGIICCINKIPELNQIEFGLDKIEKFH